MWTKQAPIAPGFYFIKLDDNTISIAEIKKELEYMIFKDGSKNRELWIMGWDLPVYDYEIKQWWSERIQAPDEQK